MKYLRKGLEFRTFRLNLSLCLTFSEMKKKNLCRRKFIYKTHIEANENWFNNVLKESGNSTPRLFQAKIAQFRPFHQLKKNSKDIPSASFIVHNFSSTIRRLEKGRNNDRFFFVLKSQSLIPRFWRVKSRFKRGGSGGLVRKPLCQPRTFEQCIFSCFLLTIGKEHQPNQPKRKNAV